MFGVHYPAISKQDGPGQTLVIFLGGGGRVGFQVAITNSDCIPSNFTGQTEQHEAHFNKQSNL